MASNEVHFKAFSGSPLGTQLAAVNPAVLEKLNRLQRQMRG